MAARSSSSVAELGFRQKFGEAFTFLKWRLGDRSAVEEATFVRLDSIRATYERITGRSFASARVFEIGYGARPLRLFALMSMGIDAHGIDLDRPMLKFSVPALARIWRSNGLERAVKTCFRSALFDGKDRARLDAGLRLRGYSLKVDKSRLLVGDASAHDYAADIDLVYSDDVFEHIPPEVLSALVAKLGQQLSPECLLIITPNVFTGITGGHHAEWYPHLVDDDRMERKTEPWEHLRKGRSPANTYLNKLSRADYRNLLGQHFEIIEEKVLIPDSGRMWLTPQVREELAQWREDELFSNKVEFVLRPKVGIPNKG